MKNISLAICTVALLLGPIVSTGASPPQRATSKTLEISASKPESVGFSSERLERLHKLMQETVDQKQIAGIVTILARHG